MNCVSLTVAGNNEQSDLSREIINLFQHDQSISVLRASNHSYWKPLFYGKQNISTQNILNKTLSIKFQSFSGIAYALRLFNPISTGGEGGGVFPTSSPVNSSELQNLVSHYFETW